MKILKLIEKLQKIAEKHGDIQVDCRNYRGGTSAVCTVSARTFSDGTFCKIDASTR